MSGRVIIFHERQLRQLLESYWDYYHRVRPHRSLDRDSPFPRTVESPDRGKVIELPLVRLALEPQGFLSTADLYSGRERG